MKEFQVLRNGAQFARRDLLQALIAACASSLLKRPAFGGILMSSENLIPAKTAVDHLILGASDLDQAVEWFEKATGVKPLIGGVHPGRGTRNALVSLGGRQYLEIMVPDPAQQVASLPYDLKSLATPRLVHWAAATNDIDSIAQKAHSAGMSVFGPRDGSRARPDGRMLRWKTLDVQNRMGGVRFAPIPFFIEWAADSPHPSQDSPKGCEFLAFEMAHPDSTIISESLNKLGIESKIMQSKESRLRATLKTPKGKVELS